ncbi:MAG TPA: hypothetical protein VKM54_10320 [Myxococcota bacterium]|nr:hypothetical protein [Myxococcota bacterium]
MPDEAADEPITVAQLGKRREQTEAIARLVGSHLEQHLEILRPAFDPRRLLGRHASLGSTREDVPGADQALRELTQRYTQVAGAPFSLRSEFPPDAVAGMDHRLAVYPWEYEHEARGAHEQRTIRITSPLRWVLTYRSAYTLEQLRGARTKQELRESDVAQFVVNMLVMRAMLDKFAPLKQLLTDLRFEVGLASAEGFGKLPLVTIASHLPTLRPPDDLILTVTGFSGVAAFIEVIDRDPLRSLRDPLREAIERILV